MDMEDRFAAVESEYLQFDRVTDKKSMRSDVHAWILLDELFPDSKHCMMDQVTYDQVYLSVSKSQPMPRYWN